MIVFNLIISDILENLNDIASIPCFFAKKYSGEAQFLHLLLSFQKNFQKNSFYVVSYHYSLKLASGIWQWSLLKIADSLYWLARPFKIYPYRI